jgi:hypothetical protein
MNSDFGMRNAEKINRQLPTPVPCALSLPGKLIKNSIGAGFEKSTTETHGRSRKMKLLRSHLLFSAAGGLIFLCNSVKNPWLIKIKIRLQS